jgi:hypothetical protein
VSYGYFGSTLVDELNRLATGGGAYPPRSDYLDTAAAARAWAASIGQNLGDITDTVGVLNLIYNESASRSDWLDIAGICNKIAGTTGLEPAAALREVSS